MTDFTDNPTAYYPGPTPVTHRNPAPDPDPAAMRQESVRLTRQQAREMRRIEARGVPYWLKRTRIEAKVTGLSFGDEALLAGLPTHLQDKLASTLSSAESTTKKKTFADYLRGAKGDERLANLCCVAGFIEPKLVLTEDEERLADDDDVWWVGNIHLTDRKEFMIYLMGNAGEEELKRIAGFLDARVEDSATG